MTTIVIRDGILAADTMILSGGRAYGTMRKIARSRDGWWAAGAGDAAVISAFLKWIETRSLGLIKPPFKGLPEAWDKSGMLLMDLSGSMYFYEGHSIVSFNAPFAAEGSGSDIAIGAMEMGADAIEAVRVAIKHDPASGGEIEYVKAGNKRVNRAK